LVRRPSPSHPPPSVDFIVLPFCFDRRNVADPISELVWAMLLCSGKPLFWNYIRERRGATGNYIPPTPVLHPIRAKISPDFGPGGSNGWRCS
jgi:hypothetical protein